MAPKDPEVDLLKAELLNIIKKCQDDQQAKADVNLEEATASVADVPKCRLGSNKILKGHLNKVNSVHFSGDSRHCVSGSLDGKLIIWDSWTGNKIQIIPLRSAWVMSVAYAQSGNFVACGGMDNQCTIYDLKNRDNGGVAKLTRELLGYEGFLSCCRFVNDTTLITGSGDMKVIFWDLEANKRLQEFDAHNGDVCTLSLSPDNNTYVTGSVDRTCKLWDVRDPSCKQVFFGHEGDVNCVCFHPGGYSFITASEDKTARLYDIRSDQQIATYKTPTPGPGFTCCGLSISGRLLLAGTDEKSVHIWDTLKVQHNGILTGHENRITSMSVSPNGMALVTSSWDNNLRVWI
ncbi:hypothetical protein V9T40_014670 [Parthenolecanium corni]|uniref:Uncharacterized protein n=1 Tax=Parthenolecanium corni TaxID=536013 RepID=A0AAN9T2J3_9HEMI